jgi:tRNA pseudouridine32 synthase / 23S rRNA pseudouridine746 synthase
MSQSSATLHCRILLTQTACACDFLALHTGLPKGRIKDAMNKGAVWLKRPGNKEKRIRKATFSLLPGDILQLYYDPKVLALVPPLPHLIAEERHYSVWYKPANLLTQGSRYGDHCSLVRFAGIFFKNNREIFPVHRLDREAFGLVLLAHDRRGASALSLLFRQGKIEKKYRVEVRGRIDISGKTLTLAAPLDGKEAITEISAISSAVKDDKTTLDIRLHTGRFHQIRRHLSNIGHHVIGDPQYGSPGSKACPMQLCAYSLQFRCPFTRKLQTFSV